MANHAVLLECAVMSNNFYPLLLFYKEGMVYSI